MRANQHDIDRHLRAGGGVLVRRDHPARRVSAHFGRRGNQDRRGLLLDSRDDAWSPAEREAHRLFRAEGIRGWVGNYALPLLGAIYYLDIAFPRSAWRWRLMPGPTTPHGTRSSGTGGGRTTSCWSGGRHAG